MNTSRCCNDVPPSSFQKCATGDLVVMEMGSCLTRITAGLVYILYKSFHKVMHINYIYNSAVTFAVIFKLSKIDWSSVQSGKSAQCTCNCTPVLIDQGYIVSMSVFLSVHFSVQNLTWKLIISLYCLNMLATRLIFYKMVHIETHLLEPRSESSAKVKVKFKVTFSKNGHFVALVFHKLSISLYCLNSVSYKVHLLSVIYFVICKCSQSGLI